MVADLIVRRGLAAGAVAGAAALSLRALARPLPASTERRLLDWEAVRRTAHARTGEEGPIGVPNARTRGLAYDALAAELAPLMAEVCQAPVAGFPHVDVLDRRGFVDANLVIVRRLLEPVERLRATIPESRMTAVGRVALSRYVGELFGFLSRRVLGQYDPVLMLVAPDQGPAPGPALSLVEPNIAEFERRQSVPSADLRRWLVLHELTHAWQFESHPWLREHIASTMSDLLLKSVLAELAARDEAGAAGAATAVARRRPPASPVHLVRSALPAVRDQLSAVGRIQAVMSVTEGYSNYVMHQVGDRHVPDFARLDRAFHDRKRQRSLLEQVVLTVTGMRMKLRQYDLGERFAEAVVRERGLATLNRVWEGPELMPTLAELREPARWIARVA
ncbi:MAG TPA: zinc-dependent metalloprotease [Candidatus Dormibacteraeota bacterium]|nr:zinc-dependent metalloprotease [Candidatus Dormibacteraeota bacterium]